MEFNEITMSMLLSWIGGVSVIVGFVAMVGKPFKKYDERLKTIEQYKQTDNERLNDLEKDTKLILRSVKVLVAHSVSGNSTGELKKIQNEIDEYLISK